MSSAATRRAAPTPPVHTPDDDAAPTAGPPQPAVSALQRSLWTRDDPALGGSQLRLRTRTRSTRAPQPRVRPRTDSATYRVGAPAPSPSTTRKQHPDEHY